LDDSRGGGVLLGVAIFPPQRYSLHIKQLQRNLESSLRTIQTLHLRLVPIAGNYACYGDTYSLASFQHGITSILGIH
jgi:hypothetical protein